MKKAGLGEAKNPHSTRAGPRLEPYYENIILYCDLARVSFDARIQWGRQGAASRMEEQASFALWWDLTLGGPQKAWLR